MIPLLLATFGLAMPPQGTGEARMDGQAERETRLTKAMASVRAAIPAAGADAGRPAFHYRPPAQWMNDPNGPIFHNGWYHLFYQFNPYGDQWGDMHWGHARSRDMVDWEQLPIALWPSKSRGEDHVFSGSTFRDGAGRPTILYTSIGGRAPEQWAATPSDDDLIGWAKSGANPVLTTAAHGPMKIDEWRDPFLFRAAGETYMVVGGAHEGRGIVALYRAKGPDLTAWDSLGIVFRHPDAGLVECPNIVRIGDRWVLLVSVHGRVEAFVGALDLAGRTFRSERRSVLADGSYASQLLTDREGRVVHWAWLRTGDHKGWNGCMTLPSVLTLARDGTPRLEPLPSLSKLRDRETKLANVPVEGTLDLSSRAGGKALEIVAEIDPGRASALVLRLAASADGRRATTLSYDPKNRTLFTPGRPPVTLRATKNGHLKLRLFLDRSVLDVYADGGATTQISSLPLHAEDVGLSLTAEGGPARIVTMSLFSLRPAAFDLERFRK